MTAAFYILMANYLFHAKQGGGRKREKGMFMPRKPELKAGSFGSRDRLRGLCCRVSLFKNLGSGFPCMGLLCFPLSAAVGCREDKLLTWMMIKLQE